MAMMMACARKIPHAYISLKRGQWDRKSFKGVELFQKTLGIIGLGRIGLEVAKRAKAFQMKEVAFDPFLTPEKAKRLGIVKSDLDDVYGQADFITVHTPLTKETRHLIDERAFQKMKPGVRIINCARGGIIDEHALYNAILSRRVSGAALDVFEDEPPINHPLFELPEVIATPHLGASTVEAQEKVARDVSLEVLRVLRNEPAHHALNLPAIPDDVREALMPYFELGEKLGETAGQLLEGIPIEADIIYSGELSVLETSPLTRSVLKGILSRYLSDHINVINVTHYIKEAGLTYNVKREPHSRGFTSLVKVKLYSKKNECSVSGALLNGYGARIVNMDDFSVDLPMNGHMIYIQHHDLPGLIGNVGTLLGEHGINIGSMQVGRKSVGGHAIMVLTVDKHVDDRLLSQMKTIAHINEVKRLDL
ncbi:MAG: phosphoglycerate dehydrogenase, partial [Tuberibacillus sp.]